MNLNIKNVYAWPLTTRLLVLGLMCAVIFYLGYLYDLADLRTSVTDAVSQEEEIKEQINSVIKKEITISDEVAKYPKTQLLFKDWQNQLIKYDQIPSLLNEILKAGATNHVYYALFSPLQVERSDIYSKLPIKIIAVGSYHQLAQFLSQIANMQWIIVIGDFVLTNENKNDEIGAGLAQQASKQGLITGQLTLAIYYLPEVPYPPEPKPGEKGKPVPPTPTPTPSTPGEKK